MNGISALSGLTELPLMAVKRLILTPQPFITLFLIFTSIYQMRGKHSAKCHSIRHFPGVKTISGIPAS
ncbi:protein of unknown function [Georgfuchsia toluolica]|uniref:Uncharacterized protein n=1 Tax=Georgfuchsia toluolica TaxID=424218 RepID=A0A916J395_9PROT|nr:protein of unknown function [Georgfuchsia toluolica]